MLIMTKTDAAVRLDTIPVSRSRAKVCTWKCALALGAVFVCMVILGAETYRLPVKRSVSSASHQPQVLNAVVESIAIDVMNDFLGVRFQITPKMLLHDQSVRRNLLAVNGQKKVSIINRSCSICATGLIEGVVKRSDPPIVQGAVSLSQVLSSTSVNSACFHNRQNS